MENDKKYKGLANIGATCYMNSLLQTLFMTPEFRFSIYRWRYNPKLHPKEQDSILFQLQKLFGKLQLLFPGEVTTKELVKSFQWEDEEVHMQQDIQEFNRLLFEALEKSLITKSQKYLHKNFVSEYFEGELVHYTKCTKCGNQSQREDDFQDLIITVKNIYEKMYSGSLELGFQRYLKPEILEGENAYACDFCGQKTRAERGTRFIKMPTILNVILQRFNFNYFTMQRQKVNDRVQFPYVLNFNDYIQGYDKIPKKLDEDSSAYFKKTGSDTVQKPINPLKNHTSYNNKIKKKPTSTTPSVAGKTKTKPSANTKSFLAEMRKRKKQQQQQNQDLVYVSGTTSINQQVNGMVKAQSMQQVQIPSGVNNHGNEKNAKSQEFEVGNEEENKRKRELNRVKENSEADIVKKNAEEKFNVDEADKTATFTIEQQQSQKSPQPTKILPPPPLDILPSDLTVPYKKSQLNGTSSIQDELQQRRQKLKCLEKQKNEKLKEYETKKNELITKYLKEGPLVYELYAIMIHNGSANHGHYFSYIKSFEDDKWYCFDDQKVKQINVTELEKTFGNGNSNAYALYYKLVEQSEQHYTSISQEPIPDYIQQKIQLQKQNQQKNQKQKIDNLQNLVVLKIYYQLYVKQLQAYRSTPLSLVHHQARQLFNITQTPLHNTRLRLFNPVTETKLETFTGRQEKTLQQLNIGSYKSMLLEVKKEEEEFEEYEEGVVGIRIAFLKENKELSCLDQNYLKLHKIFVKKSVDIAGLRQAITDKRNEILQNQPNDQKLTVQQLCLIKRHQNNDQTIHEVISCKDYLKKNLQQLSIFQNEILFAEPLCENLRWPTEFQNQMYRISIKYNKPGTNEYHNYLTDSRITVKQLKMELCELLKVDTEEIIMKWGTKSGRELKDGTQNLKDARFIVGSQIYFDYGIPAKVGEVRVQLYLATDAPNEIFSRLHQFQYITDVPISGALKSSQAKTRFVEVMKKIKNIQLNPQQFRIRQKVSDKLGKIYRERPMREQQLIQKRQIAIELISDNNLDLKQYSIYCRLWNQDKWQLSPKIQLLVTKTTTMKQLSEIIAVNEKNKILHQPEDMAICRILSIHKFNIIDLTEMEWFEMAQDVPVIGEPMFVNADGLLYIVKSIKKQPRELTKEEQKKFGGVVKPAIVRNKPRVYQPKEAKGMKIKVVEKEEEQSPKKQQGVKELSSQKTEKN